MNECNSSLDAHLAGSLAVVLAQISPGRNPAYSPNLHAWLSASRWRRVGHLIRVYRAPASDGIGAGLWIGCGVDGDLIGARLMAVLCNPKEPSAAWQLKGKQLVADFWPRYTLIGRCAIDEGHTVGFVDEGTRWRVNGDSRQCVWCGQTSQTLLRWSEVQERSEWVNELPASPGAPVLATADN